MSKHNKLCKEILEALKEKADRDKVIKNPKLTHGSHEYGVDIIFNIEDGFGQSLKCGVLVVSGDINTSKLHPILGQLSVSFGHEFSKKPDIRLLDLVYIITDGEFSPPADEYLNAANVGFRNIICLERNQLAPFLKEYRLKKEETEKKKRRKSNLIRET